MNNYDLYRLNDKEFEALCADLISRQIGVRVERFKPGKDQGVDGRFFSTDNQETILQCKHWMKSGFSRLLAHLQKTESKKVVRLQPDRYIFLTSVELSRHNKKQIASTFAPFVKSEGDIYGHDDIIGLLSDYEDLEKKYYKLWMSSTTVLQRILNSAIVGRSDFKLERIRNSSARYVLTSNHKSSLLKLEELGSVIITGEPGIGKTTLAEQICLNYVIKDFEFVTISDAMTEAESVYKRGKKQIFYFDDFLGRNFLNALSRKEDSQVIEFMMRVLADKTKRFVLTSRTTVLNQGKRLSDLFRIENVDRNEHEIHIKSLSLIERATILYNHIWHSELSEEYIDQLYFEDRYKQIILHRNFNPRLIEFITDYYKVCDINPDDYWDYVSSTLDDPQDIWGHVFDNQIDEKSRLLVSLVAFNGKSIYESELKNAFSRLTSEPLGVACSLKISDFETTARFATGAVINRTVGGYYGTNYDLFNPALADYLIRRFADDHEFLCQIFKSLTTVVSLRNLKSLSSSRSIQENTFDSIIRILAKALVDGLFEGSSLNYLLNLYELILSRSDMSNESRNKIATHIGALDFMLVPDNLLETCSIIISSMQYEAESEYFYKQVDKFVDSVLHKELRHDELLSASNFIVANESAVQSRDIALLKNKIVNLWKDPDYVQDELLEHEESYNIFEYEKMEKGIRICVENKLGEYPLDFATSIIDEICAQVDPDVILERNFDPDYNDLEPPSEDGLSYDPDSMESVEDLFQRG